MDFFPGLRIRPPACFGGQEEVFPVPNHPGAYEDFRIAIPGGGVDVIHPVLQQDFQGPIRVFPRGSDQGRAPEDCCRALVAGAAE